MRCRRHLEFIDGFMFQRNFLGRRIKTGNYANTRSMEDSMLLAGLVVAALAPVAKPVLRAKTTIMMGANFMLIP